MNLALTYDHRLIDGREAVRLSHAGMGNLVLRAAVHLPRTACPATELALALLLPAGHVPQAHQRDH